MTTLQAIFYVVTLIVSIGGVLGTYLLSEGGRRRQLTNLKEDMAKSFEHHKLHFAHSSQVDIHQRSMSVELLDANFKLVHAGNQHLAEKIEAHVQEDMRVMRGIQEELVRLRESIDALRGDMRK